MSVLMISDMPGTTRADYDHLVAVLGQTLAASPGFVTHGAGPVGAAASSPDCASRFCSSCSSIRICASGEASDRVADRMPLRAFLPPTKGQRWHQDSTAFSEMASGVTPARLHAVLNESWSRRE